MSNPLKRQFAKAALLLAAGAAPVIGAAGHAGAAEQPQSSGLTGLSALDGDGVGDTLDTAARTATGAAGELGGNTVVKTATPLVAPLGHQVAADTGSTAGSLAQDATQTLAHRASSLQTLDATLPAVDNVNTPGLSLL